MLIQLALTRLKQMARRVLERPGKVVNHTVLYAITIYGVGCIIPTPLDQQPSPTKYAPSIDVIMTNPTLGAISRSADANTVWSWHVAASDANTGDTLYAEIAERRSEAEYKFPVAVPLTKQPLVDERGPARWSGDSASLPWCLIYGQGVHYIFVYVSDGPFTTSGDIDMGTGSPFTTAGLADSNHWEVTCT
jgi:hypothetical protein